MKFRYLVYLIVIMVCLPTSLLAQGGASGQKSPPRDSKTGRFIKAIKRKLPARDPKTGRFVKRKKLPMRDPKTGRFMKAPAPAGSEGMQKAAHDNRKTIRGKKSGDSGRKLPPRDPKTGRFIKKK
jgi:hypothetical protein